MGRFLCWLGLMLALLACAPATKQKTKPVEKIHPVVVKVKKSPVKPPPKLEPNKSVLILLSSSAKSYQLTARYISEQLQWEQVQITLSGQLAQDNAMIREVKESDHSHIVAIGPKAARALKGIRDKQIVFTQVVNYADYDLLTKNVSGVSSLPSPEKLFKDWRALSPKLSQVALVTGRNLDTYINRARKAAKKQGIELLVQQVRTDKEFIYRSKNLKAAIDGQWILPDNRVLSAKALKEVMAYGSRRGRQIVVFGPKLLSFGGFFFVSSDPKAIAQGVLDRLSETAKLDENPDVKILPVMTHTMGINQNIARQFNLIIPGEYRKYINGE